MPLRLCYPRNLSVTIISFDIFDSSVHRLSISKKSASIANNKTEKKCEKGTALKLKTFKMYRKARKSFQGTIMSETLWGAQSLFSFQVEEKELLSACGETINLIALRKILRSDGNVTHSLNPWLTHSPLLNSNMWILHPQCLTSVWSPGGDVKETRLHLRAKVGWSKENPLLATCQIFYSSLKTDYFDKVTDVFLIIFKRIDSCARHCNYYSSSSLPTGGMWDDDYNSMHNMFSDHTLFQIHF